MTDAETNAEHLRLLSVFHYVVGGIIGLMACFPIIHVAAGAMLLTTAPSAQGGPPPAIGLLFIMMGGTFVLAGWTLAVLEIAAGRCLARRKHYSFCFAIACLSCAFMPLGTVLGVFTIMVLMRPTVRPLFESHGTVP